ALGYCPLLNEGIDVLKVRVQKLLQPQKSEMPIASEKNAEKQSERVNISVSMEPIKMEEMRTNISSTASISSSAQKTRTRPAFKRHKVVGNGECGYTAFGITRKEAYELLKKNIDNKEVQGLLRPIVEETLLDKDFIQYAVEKKLI